jgi:outer membrane protein OmpA-like peptidoglycan-associated protein
MNTKAARIIFVLTVLLKVPALAVSMNIHQEPYTFRMNMTKDITCNTFVIAEPVENLPAVRCRLSVAHFELASADLSPTAAAIILADLKRCQISEDDTLQVTGYACSQGPERLNQKLSQLRAEAVAALLRRNGFTVGAVEGAGSHHPITNIPAEMHQNRRVEIDFLRSTTHEDFSE